MFGGLAVGRGEDAVEITDIFIANRHGNIRHVSFRVFQQKCRLGQAFFLHNLGIGFPRYVFPVFGTARLGQKIRRSAADGLFRGS